MKRFATPLLVLALGIAPAAQAGTIVDVAAGDENFSTLVAAVTAAGLGNTLATTPDITVFAPTNEAFDSLPPGVVGKLLMESNKDLLIELLQYHVVGAKVMAADVVTLDEATTLLGETIDIKVNKKGVKLNSSNVIQTDIVADNGVIHVIDKVLLPKGFVGKLNSR